jgi:quinol monooxygenase YgiN
MRVKPGEQHNPPRYRDVPPGSIARASANTNPKGRKMITIQEGSAPLTVINVFTVSPENQSDLVRLLGEMTERAVRHIPGFLTTSIHVSIDGTKVVNYAQWENGEALGGLFANPDAQQYMGQITSISESDPGFYKVAQAYDVRAAEPVSAQQG